VLKRLHQCVAIGRRAAALGERKPTMCLADFVANVASDMRERLELRVICLTYGPRKIDSSGEPGISRLLAAIARFTR